MQSDAPMTAKMTQMRWSTLRRWEHVSLGSSTDRSPIEPRLKRRKALCSGSCSYSAAHIYFKWNGTRTTTIRSLTQAADQLDTATIFAALELGRKAAFALMQLPPKHGA